MEKELSQSSSTNARTGNSVATKFFEPAKLVGLEKMRFTTRRRVEGAYSGRHVAKRRGGAGEFIDYREYAPGDDLRRLDWKALARTNRSYIKLFQDETDLRCTLLLDCSGSMSQGGRSPSDQRGSKLAWAQYFAAALAHLIVLGRDAVGLCTVRSQLDEHLPASSSMQQRALLHQSIEQLVAEGATDLARGIEGLFLQTGRRGVLLVISDFLVSDLENVIAGFRKFRSRGWEVINLHVTHPDEVKLPTGNAFRFIGCESDGEINCEMTAIRTAYEDRFQKHLKTTRSALLAAGCDYHLVSVTDSYLDVLRSFLVERNA